MVSQRSVLAYLTVKSLKILKGYSYVLFPTLEAYRAPWPTLVTILRESLVTLNLGAKKLAQGNTKDQGSSMWDRGRNKIAKSAPSKSSIIPSRTTQPIQASAKTIPSSEGEATNLRNPSDTARPQNSVSSSSASQNSEITKSTVPSLGKRVPITRKWTTAHPKPPGARSYSTRQAPDPESHNSTLR